MFHFRNPLQRFVLVLLSDEPRTGYRIIKDIETITEGWKPSCGSIYPILTDLENRGLITHKKSGNKKIYSITERGQRIVDAFKEKFRDIPKVIRISTNIFLQIIKSSKKRKQVISDTEKIDLNTLEELLSMFKLFLSVYAELSEADKTKFNRVVKSTIKELEKF